MTTVIRTHYLEVNDVPLATPRVEIPDLDALFNDPPLRGVGGIPMSGAFGRRPFAPIPDAAQWGPIPLNIDCSVDDDGDPVTGDPLEEMETFRESLSVALGYGKQTDLGLVPVTFHRGDLDPKQGDAIFLGLTGWVTLNARLGQAFTTFDLWLPDGELSVVGS